MIWSGNDDSDLVDVAKVSKQFSLVKISKGNTHFTNRKCSTEKKKKKDNNKIPIKILTYFPCETHTGTQQLSGYD